MSIKIGINGFGRIGRLVLRAARNFPQIQVISDDIFASDEH